MHPYNFRGLTQDISPFKVQATDLHKCPNPSTIESLLTAKKITHHNKELIIINYNLYIFLHDLRGTIGQLH
jgi:hypothetical protein